MGTIQQCRSLPASMSKCLGENSPYVRGVESRCGISLDQWGATCGPLRFSMWPRRRFGYSRPCTGLPDTGSFVQFSFTGVTRDSCKAKTHEVRCVLLSHNTESRACPLQPNQHAVQRRCMRRATCTTRGGRGQPAERLAGPMPAAGVQPAVLTGSSSEGAGEAAPVCLARAGTTFLCLPRRQRQ